MDEYKQSSYALRKAIEQSQFNGSDTRCIWQGVQTIMDYKWKTSHVADTDSLLPDKLNIFFTRFKDNKVSPAWANTGHEECELSFYVADMSKTFKCVNPRKAASPDGIHSRVLRACAECLKTY